jgi:hypothetical protein
MKMFKMFSAGLKNNDTSVKYRSEGYSIKGSRLLAMALA